MKIYSWNVNGIRAVWNKELLQKFLAEHDPDILCLQETKANKDQLDFDLGGYHEYWNSAEKKGYSGTAIFSKKPIKNVFNGFLQIVNDEYSFTDEYGDCSKEGRVLTAELDDFWLVTVYTPNAKDKNERLNMRSLTWDPAFLMHVKELEKTKPVLFCGDLNVAPEPIDLARPKENVGKHGFTAEERAGFANYLAAGFIDSFRYFHPDLPAQYTWWTAWGGARARNVGWRIDHFLTTKSFGPRIASAKIHPDVMGSDHCPVSIEIS
jgi:exodeoxyribonuclease III